MSFTLFKFIDPRNFSRSPSRLDCHVRNHLHIFNNLLHFSFFLQTSHDFQHYHHPQPLEPSYLCRSTCHRRHSPFFGVCSRGIPPTASDQDLGREMKSSLMNSFPRSTLTNCIGKKSSHLIFLHRLTVLTLISTLTTRPNHNNNDLIINM